MLRREIIVGVVLLVVVALQSESAVENFSIPLNTGCACPGEILTYSCTAVGPGNSLWEGSVFDCPGNSITLRHSQYRSGTSGACNEGDITARSIEVDNDCYTSQLSIRVSPNFNNRLVNCTHDSTVGLKNIGSSTLTILEAPYPSPGNVRLIDVQEGLLTFSWNSPGQNCDSANYRIVSDCGSCPNTTKSTAVNCRDLQLSTERRECRFRVHVMLCDDVGNQSDPVAVTLKLPDVPNVQFIPRFSDVTGQLTTLLATISQTVSYSIADGFSGSVQSYIMKIISDFDIVLNSSLTPVPCDDILGCAESVSAPFQCSSSTAVNATLSAANRLGVGPTSDAIKIDCVNNFVEVMYDSAASTITCTFLDQPDVAFFRSCRVQYGDCLSKLTGVSNDTTTANDIVLNLQLSESSQEYCYLVTASNGSNIVMVEGRINTASSFPIAATVAIVLITCVILVLVIILFVAALKFSKRSAYDMRVPEDYFGHTPLNQFNVATVATAAQIVKDADDLTVESRFNLKRIDLNEMTFLRLISSYPTQLITYVESAIRPRKFERGYAFYEFLYKEDISDVKEIIFMNEDGEFFTPDVDKATLYQEKLAGEDLIPPQFKGYRVFIQSTGSGRRYIPKDSIVLYKSFLRIQKHPLIRVDATKFALRKVPSDCALEDFCRKCVPEANINAVYVELDCLEDVDSILDVLLIDKSTDQIFTGARALQMAKQHYDQSKIIDNRHWRIYVFKNFGEMFQMRKDMCILYQIEPISLDPQLKPPETEQELKVTYKGGDEVHQLTSQDPLMLYSQTEQDIEAADNQLNDILNPHQYMKPPLNCVDSTTFVIAKMEKACTLETFREKHALNVDVHNVFIESSNFGQNFLESNQILDIILEDQKNENILYTCSAVWKNIKEYSKDMHRWRVYVLMDLGRNFTLKNGTWVLYRAKAKLLSDNSLIPVDSDHFKKAVVGKKCTIDDYKKAQPRKCNVFLELSYVPKKEKIVDVVLLEKATQRLFSGPGTRNLVKKHLSGAQDLDQEKWQAFVFCKFKSGLKLANDTQVLHQDFECVAQEFHVLIVDEDDVRMSKFIEMKFGSGSYKKGAAFYEYTQEEDLLSYREVIHVPKGKIQFENGSQSADPPNQAALDDKEGKSQTLQTSQEKMQLESDTTLFYGIFGAPGLEIKPPTIRDKRIFIQCTSQGSRCLHKGMLILYKVEKTVDDHRRQV